MGEKKSVKQPLKLICILCARHYSPNEVDILYWLERGPVKVVPMGTIQKNRSFLIIE